MKEGWEIIDLGSVCHVQRGLTYSGKDTVDISDQVVLRATNIDLGTGKLIFDELKYLREDLEIKPVYALKKDSLLICFSSGSKSHLGKIALVDDDYPNFFFGGFIGQINPSEKIDSKYLFYCLSSETYKDYISNLTDGVNINNLKATDLKSFQIPLPPLPEQQRIVSILDEAFAAIAKAKANAEQNLKNAKELFESYLQGVFENGNWETKTIQEITKVVNGYAFASKDFKPTNTVKSVKITNVGVKEFVEEADNYLPEKFKETLKDFQVKEGNIVIALTRTIISAGLKVAVVPASYDGALVNQRVAALVPNEKLVNQNFLYFYLTTSGVAKYVLEHVNTLMQPNLSINDLKNMPVPCPPLKDQQTIVRQLDALRAETQKLEAVYQKKIADLEELKKSILQKAFKGELTESKIKEPCV
ncbi:restriction endonuclease subunit S [Moheibacter sp.]|uniref:restriction endonuclease subunit S n=1 Tax=Moheibacter sp. TaxID=1965316 RepID=UPI003C777E49